MSISPENEQFIQHVIEAGTFRDRNEVLNEAINLLKGRQALLDHIDKGVQQIASGDYIEYDERALRERFGELERRVTHRIDASRRST